MLQALRDGNDLDTAEGRARMLAQAAPLLEALGAPGLRLQIGHALAAQAGIGREELDAYLEESAGSREPWAGSGATRAGRGARAGGASGGPERGDGPDGWPDRWPDSAGAPPDYDDPGPAAPGGNWSEHGGAGRSGRGSYPDSGGRAGRGGGRSGRQWRGTQGRDRGPPPRARPPARRPDLERRLRLLGARHPALAAEAAAASYLPAGLAAWFAELARLPAGADFEAACGALEATAPEDVRRARDDAARDPVAIVHLGEDEALAEMRDALAQLRQRDLRAQIDALVGAGLESEADRLKYQELMALARQT